MDVHNHSSIGLHGVVKRRDKFILPYLYFICQLIKIKSQIIRVTFMMVNSLSSLEAVSFSRRNKFYEFSYQNIGIAICKINC